MTDNEIIKALECCQSNADCANCPYYENNHHQCGDNFNKDALDLINRQRAKVERLQARCENTQIGYNFAKDEIRELTKDKFKLQKALNQSEDYRAIAKAEAIKEVLDRFDIEYCKVFSIPEISFMKEFKRVFLKEMVGDCNAE